MFRHITYVQTYYTMFPFFLKVDPQSSYIILESFFMVISSPFHFLLLVSTPGEESQGALK